MIPGGLLLPFVRGGAQAGEVSVEDLKAVVAISPAGGGTLAAWGAEGLRALEVPTAAHPGRSRPHGRLCHRRARHFRRRGQRAAISPDLPGRRPLDRAHSAAGIDAQTLMGSGMVSGSGMESGAGERNQRPFHHRVSGSLRQGRRIARGVPGRTGGEIRGGGLAGAGAGLRSHSRTMPTARGRRASRVWKGFQRSEAAGLEMLRSGTGTVGTDSRRGRLHRRSLKRRFQDAGAALPGLFRFSSMHGLP